ncbi:MAG: hypothetical protein KDJ47_05885 [Hyphomicrobiaceae bacterium]|nr:hypothetical protein [Hyphomicrobiaceae bacterium]
MHVSEIFENPTAFLRRHYSPETPGGFDVSDVWPNGDGTTEFCIRDENGDVYDTAVVDFDIEVGPAPYRLDVPGNYENWGQS